MPRLNALHVDVPSALRRSCATTMPRERSARDAVRRYGRSQRQRAAERRPGAGTQPALTGTMAKTHSDPLTVPLLVILWTVMLCGLIMVLVVVMMH